MAGSLVRDRREATCACLRGIAALCLVASLLSESLAEYAEQDLFGLDHEFARIDFGHPMLAGLGEQQRMLLEEYREAFLQLRRFYENLTLRGRHVLHEEAIGFPRHTGSLLPLKADEELVFMANDRNLLRLDRTRPETVRLGLWPVILDFDGGIGTTIRMITPEEHFTLSKTRHNKYTVMSNTKGQRIESLFELYQLSFHHVPFTFSSSMPMATLLFAKCPFSITDKIIGIEVAGSGGEEIVTVTTERRETSDGPLWGTRVMKFHRDKKWALQSVHVLSSRPASEEYPRGYMSAFDKKCTYSAVVDGFPLLESCIQEWSYGDVGDSVQELTLVKRSVFTVAEITPGGADAELFDVERLLSTGVDAEATASGYRVILAVSMLVVLAVGSLLRPWEGWR